MTIIAITTHQGNGPIPPHGTFPDRASRFALVLVSAARRISGRFLVARFDILRVAVGANPDSIDGLNCRDVYSGPPPVALSACLTGHHGAIASRDWVIVLPQTEPFPTSSLPRTCSMKLWRVWLGFAISAVFLVVAFRGQDFGQIRDALSGVNYIFLPLALLFYFAGVWIRALRWSVLLRPVVRVSTRQIFPIVVVGFMANNVLPLRTGELVRSYALSSRHGVRKTSVLATIAVERLFDGLILLGFMLAATTVITFTSELRHLALVAFILFACVLIGLFALTLSGNLLDKLVQLVVGPLPASVADRVERLAESFLSGLGVLKRSTDLSIVAGTSLLAWLLEASMYWILARGFEGEIRESVGIGAMLLTTGVANLATLIPSSPGYIGQFEYGVKLVVNGALGVPASDALAYAILVHAALYFPITIWGIVEWFRQNLSLGKVRDLREDATPSPAAAKAVSGSNPRPAPAVPDQPANRH